jgi:predicted nucleotidyltransferase
MLEVIERNLDGIAELCRRHGIRRLDLFGSAASGAFDPATSDLDFFYEFEDYSSPGIADHWFDLQDELTALLGHRIDLVSSRNATNPYFLEVANRHRVTVYAAGDAQAIG